MTKYLIDETSLTNIGDAIRTKKGTTSVIPVADMPDEILSISGGGGSSEPVSISSYTTIYSGDYVEAQSTYTLSQSWRNFDGIKITWAADADVTTYHSYGYFNKEILEYIYDNNRTLMLQAPNVNWYGQYFLTDDTTITRDNGQWDGIIKIEGFKYNRSISDFDLLTECVYSGTAYSLPTNWDEYDRLICVICSPNGYTYQTEIPHIINIGEFVIPIFVQRQSTFNRLEFNGDTVTLRGSGSTNTRIYGVNHMK